MDDLELVDYLRQYKAEKILRAKRLALISNIILIALIIGFGIYIYYNIEAFKAIGSDVCKLCINRTGMTCYSNSGLGSG